MQQLIWLALENNLPYSYHFITKAEEVIGAAAMEYMESHLVLIDASTLSKVKFPVGFAAYASFNAIVIISGVGLGSIANNHSIWEVDLSFARGDAFTAIAERLKQTNSLCNQQLLRRLYDYPTTLYAALLDPTSYPSFDETEAPLSNTMLNALTDCKSIQSYWIELDKPRAMQMFAGVNGFLNYISRGERVNTTSLGACPALAPLLIPFVHAFRLTLNVEYLRSFGRWCLAARQHWASGFQLGVSQFKSGYYCNFSERSLFRWHELTVLINDSIN